MNTDWLRRCDILFTQGEGWTSRIIRWRTQSPYSHVALVVEPTIHLGIESHTGRPSGVRAFDLRKLSSDAVDVFRAKPQFQFDADAVIRFLVAHLGARYDLQGVIWLGVLKLFGLKERANRFQREKDYFCSELVYEAFAAGGLDIVPQIGEAEITSPADIARSPRVECLHAMSECREKVTQGGNR